MPTQFPVLPFKIGFNNPKLYYKSNQQKANVLAEENLHRNRINDILRSQGIRVDFLKKDEEKKEEEEDGYNTAEKEYLRLMKMRKLDDRPICSSKRSLVPMVGCNCTDEEYAKLIKLFYHSEYEREFSSGSQTNLPEISPRYNKLRELPEKHPPRFEKQTQLWQCAPLETWDRIQVREPVLKPKYLSTLPDAKTRHISILNRKYPKDGEYIPVDEDLVELIHKDKLRTELCKPYPGYTGAKVQYFQWDSPADRAQKDEAYNSSVYKSTSNLIHRSFPPCEYEKSRGPIRKGDLSRSVSVFYPFHPFQEPPKVVGEWKTNLNLQQW